MAAATVNQGVPTPVARHLGAVSSEWMPSTETTDIEEATAVLGRAFFPVDIAPCGTDSVRIRVKGEQLPLLSIGYLDIGGEAVIRAADIPDYHIAIAVSGHTIRRWPDRRANTVTAPGAATVFMPGTDADLTSHDCTQVGIKVAQAELHRELQNLLGRPVHDPVEFGRRLDLTAPGADSWLSLTGVLGREAGRSDGLLRHQLATANLQQLLIEGLLLTQPHNYRDALSAEGPPASDAVVNQAIDLMRCYPESGWTTAELAGATGVSARGLQKAFAKSGRPPPMTYLRQVRLHRVRSDLLDASRMGSAAAVTTAAGRWGFVHLGRFAQQYRQFFGESPSQTLRRSHDGR
jgi:AraC-like DNA-binding protein